MSKYSDRVNKIYDYLKEHFNNTKYLTKSNIDLYIECSNIILSFVSKIFIGFIISVLFVQYSHQYNIFDHFKKLLRKKHV